MSSTWYRTFGFVIFLQAVRTLVRVPRTVFLAALVSVASLHASAVDLTYSWVGAASNLWSNQSNWNPVGVPGTGDNIAFPAGAPHLVQINDLPPGTTLKVLHFNGMGYRIGGNPIGLTGGVSNGGGNTFELGITLHADLTLGGGVYQGAIDVGPYRLNLGPAQFNGPVSGTGVITAAYLVNPRFSGTHPFSGVIRGGVVLTNGSFPNSSLELATEGMIWGSLQGNGTIGGAVTTNMVFPGAGTGFPEPPGTLNVGGLTFVGGMMGSSLDIFINGVVPGVGHDQVMVAGAVSISPNTFLSVSMGPSFVPTLNHVFVLIDNQGTGAVSGQFNGLPEGATITLGSYQFRLSYAGGDGNDVTLTCTLAPNVWTGAVDSKWSTPGNWTGGAPSAGAALIFPPGAMNASMINDLPVGTVLASLLFNGMGYRIGGNAIGLTGGVSNGGGNTFELGITLHADLTLGGGVYQGPIDAGPYRLNLGPAQFNGPVSGTGVITAAYLINPRFSGTHPFSGVIRGGVVLANGAFPNSSLEVATDGMIWGSLQGNGTIGGAVTTNMVFPGSPGSFPEPPGMLNVGSLTFASGMMGSSMEIFIAGVVPGVGHDQVNVAGTVSIAPNTFLNVSMSPSFVPSFNHAFVLINNQGAGPVSGQFNGLPEGATITLGSYQFRLSYAGGDGNDITLTCTLAPNVWTGAVDSKWSTPGNWTGGAPSAGAALIFPPGAMNTSMVNDLAAGTVLGSLLFNGMGYRIGGNAMGLTGGVSNGGGNVFELGITLRADLTLGGGVYQGPIDAGPYRLTVGMGSQFNGPVSGTGVIAAAYLINPRFSGTHPFSGVIRGGVVLANGAFPNSSLEVATDGMIWGSLQGNGTIGGAVTTNMLFPGSGTGSFSDPPGVLNVGSLTFASGMMGSSMEIFIEGVVPGVGHDQVNVAGTVSIAPNTFLTLSMSPSFVPTSGDTFVLVNNDGVDPVAGTFAGYPEGGIVTLQTVYQFRLSYAGGDGNDVVLVSLNGKNPTNTTLLSSRNPSSLGEPVTFTATVQGPGGTPAGEVRFRDGSTVIGTAFLAAGSATFTTGSLTAGSHAVTAEYRGDPANGGSTSPVLIQTVSVEGATPTGANVAVEVSTTLPGGTAATVDIMFGNVSAGGQTTVTATASGPTPPDGFQLGNPPVYFDVSTTATFSGNVTLCFGWTEGQFANEAAIGLWHFEGGLWVNVTTQLDTVNNVVCGRTTSLSPFALMEQRFTFTGFFKPVDNVPARNSAKAGSAVPMKFSLGGNHGLGVIAAGYPRSTQGCGTTAGASEPTHNPGGSSLHYDAETMRYNYVWKTEKAWAGSCRQFVIRFTDGTEARANFDFR